LTQANVNTVLGAFGLQMGDVVYVLASDDTDAGLFRVEQTSPTGGTFEQLAVFEEVTAADLTSFSQSNILGFEAANI
jgi:hypothetical protein